MAGFAPTTVRQPVAYDLVDQPVHICGVGTGFEGVITARIRDDKGHVLVEQPVNAGGTGIWGNFSKDLDVGSTPGTYHGSVEVFEYSASGSGQELNKQVVAITFGSALTAPNPYNGFAQHAVVAGDTLSKIAQTYYNDPNKYQIIFEANIDQLTDPNKIRVGEVLRIPQ